MRTAALVCMTLGVPSAATGAQDPPPAAVFLDVSVLTMREEPVLHRQAVVIEGGVIAWVGPVTDLPELARPQTVRVISGAGRFLLPGLADMHVHMSASDVPLFLANGVTTVRELNGSAALLALRDSIAGGQREGPRMFVASTLLAGSEQPWRHELIRTPEDAARIAGIAADAGFDALKVYDGLSAASYAALVQAAGAADLPLVGHIPREVGLEGALTAGQRGLEHTEQIMYATVGHEPAPGRISGIAATVARSGAWVTPTLASQRILARRGTAAYNAMFEAPEMRFVPDDILGWWRTLRAPGGGPEPAPDDARRQRADAFYTFQRDLTRALYEADVPLLVGTDTPNPLLVPGFSVHLELEAMVEAGIPVLEVLRAATRNAARFLGQEGEWGIVAVGAAADLILVEDNPLEDLATLRTPLGVMRSGRWLDRDALRLDGPGGSEEALGETEGTHAGAEKSPYDRWSGAYELDDGRFLVVTDLVDQMPGGAHQLMAMEHTGGWVRTLHPVEGESGVFEIGAGFFHPTPAEGDVRFAPRGRWEEDSIFVSDTGGHASAGVRAPVRRREIEFESDGARLTGALLLPPDTVEGPYPALVFVHGSGPLSRRSPEQIGYQMAAGGVAAVVFDKRGTGRSEGIFQPNRVAQHARDAVAALDHARMIPEIDSTRVGVHAASEGGFVAPLVVEARPDLAALICRVCPILPWAEALPAYVRRFRLEPAGVPPSEIEDALSFLEAQVEFALHRTGYDEMVRRYRTGEGSRWRETLGLQAPRPNPPEAPAWDVFREFLSADPSDMYRTLRAPILVLLGGADSRVPADLHAPRARVLLEAGASPAWEVWEIPYANHGLMLLEPISNGEELVPRRYPRGLHPRLVGWARDALAAR